MSAQSYSLSSLTTEIASHLGKELDEPFKRLLAQKIDSWRSRLLRNSLQEKINETKFFRQTLYVPLQKAKALPDCLNAPVCDVLRSVEKLPAPLRLSTSLFDYVGSVDGRVPFSQSTAGTGDYLRAGKYSKRLVFWDEVNDYLEISGEENLPMVRIDGVFDRPSDVMRFNCQKAGVGCNYWDEEYPITGDIAQMVVQSILQVDFGQKPTVPANKEIDPNAQNTDHAPDGR